MTEDACSTPQETLHQLHATASRSETLTTFDDLAAPPATSKIRENKTKDVIGGGLSGFYSRLKASVGGTKDVSEAADIIVGSEGPDMTGLQNTNQSRSPASTNISTPSFVSLPSSRLQSPLVPTFPDHSLPTRDSSISASTALHKATINTPKTTLTTLQSKQTAVKSLQEREDLITNGDASVPSGVDTSSRGQSSTNPRYEARNLAPSPPFRADAHFPLSEKKATKPNFAIDPREQEKVVLEKDMVLAEGGISNKQRSDGSFSPERGQTYHEKASSSINTQHPSNSSKDQDHTKHTQVIPSSQEPLKWAASAQVPLLAPAPQRPSLVHVGPSHLPGYHPSRASSSEGLSSVFTNTPVAASVVPSIDPVQRSASGFVPRIASSTQTQMRRKILDRKFWMKDENAKDCFYCGDAFSTFRRKHHCRTCGQIFDSKCTSLVSGNIFGQSGNLRVCKPCEGIIHGEEDDSSVYTDDGDQTSMYDPDYPEEDIEFDPSESDHTKIGTPTITIPMTRKTGSEKKRRSAVIEVVPPSLPRPSSSRSLRSLGGRPHPSGYRRHLKHQHMRNVRHEDRVPFHQYNPGDVHSQPNLSALHHDSIIDPDLAPFMSDDDTSEDEQASIFAILRGDSPPHTHMETDKGGFGGLLAAMRKGKSRGERSLIGVHAKETDNASLSGRHTNKYARKRNLSISSIAHRPSPRRPKSNSLLKPFSPGHSANIAAATATSPAQPFPPLLSSQKITRSASMQGRNIPKVALNQASLEHVRRMLKQMLQDAGVAHVSSWEKALFPVLLQCADNVVPDLHRGDDIDIRHYIKLKKIPGGKPRDTAYISGVVFTKNIALKNMPRSIAQPKLLIINFAIEYARHQTHFMSLDPVIAQEREYLRNLVGRIAALQPHVLLVRRNVSGLALELLEKCGIAVVYNVKETVLNAVGRCTQCKPVSSVDQLADTSRLGCCGSFDVKTYMHRNLKRTYVFLSGCQPDLGCTIALRGDEVKRLAKLKRLTEFMCYVVFNLKLETCLMRDEFVMIPAAAAMQDEPISSSDGNKASTDASAPSFYREMADNHHTKILSSSPFVHFMQPYLLNQAREYERKLHELKRLRDQYKDAEETSEEQPQEFDLVQPEMVHGVVDKASKQVREFLHAVHASEYDRALHNYNTQKRQWEAYLATNMDLFNPFNHQKIAVLYSVVNTANSTPCIGPEIIALNFYQEHDYDDGFTPDCTLGQYVEDLCHSAGMLCDVNGCNRRMLDHSRQYVHGEGQMSVIVQKHPSKIRGLQNTILMWSFCRLCGQETQTIPMSDNSWKYSFAKYLELTFWSSELHPRAGICPHDIHKDHVRFFGFNNIALRIQFDVVQLYEVIVPRPVVTWKVDSDLRLKNEQFLKIEERLDRFMVSVRARIKSIHVESVIPEKVDMCRTEVEQLLKRATEEHDWLKHKLQDKYMAAKYYEIIPMNRAIRAIQEKAIAWDETFARFEQAFFPSEKDIRRLATLQLKKLFLEREDSASSLASVEEGSNSLEDLPSGEKSPELALTPMPSGISAEKARDMLTSVVEENQSPTMDSKVMFPADLQDHSNALEPTTTDQNSVILTPIEAVERKDVRHLDLAVSALFPDRSTPRDEQTLTTPTPPSNTEHSEPSSPTPTAVPRMNPLDQHLAEAIENIHESQSSPQPANTSLESRIPRLAETIRRETTMPGTMPALSRTKSQPGSVPNSNNSFANATNALDYAKAIQIDSSRAIERLSDRLVLGAFKQTRALSKVPRSTLRTQRDVSKVSKLAEHFEQLSREFQKERMRERRSERYRQARAYPLATSKPVVEVYGDVHEAVQEHSPSEDDADPISPARASFDNSVLGDNALTETTDLPTASNSPLQERHGEGRNKAETENVHPPDISSHYPSDVEDEASDAGTAPEEIPLPDSIASSDLLSMTESQLESSLELPKHEKNTLMKMLTSFWSERSASGWSPLDYPFAQNEHVWEDSDIIVREDEPSSIIALALSSPDYLSKLQMFRGDSVPAESASDGLENLDGSIERNLLHEKNTNIRYGFTNRGVKAQIKIFYAQSFDALRRKCGVADRFVESLSRCSKWESKGGKSKSIFLKTLDDRFVLKSLSPIEVQAFFRFAPNYFAFTHQNLFRGLPSVIAKMFGLFQVQIKTPTGRDFDSFLLVMENLFYDREPNRRFDLKGSMRNRKIESTGERDEVLLDENLVDIIYSETPIFVREHTKKLLKASVWNDTLFLSQNNVMDYSLMAGFDDTNREIIVGIIDCIRTYTWDKKLESWIKDRGKNKPTITSPKDYRNRFRIAMEKYILQAPNCWHQFQGRAMGVDVPGMPRRVVVLEGGTGAGDTAERQVMEVEGGGEGEFHGGS